MPWQYPQLAGELLVPAWAGGQFWAAMEVLSAQELLNPVCPGPAAANRAPVLCTGSCAPPHSAPAAAILTQSTP